VLALCVVAAIGFAAEIKLGKPLALKQQIAIDRLVATPDKYVGKVVQVKGSVRDVCQHMGCWMELADPASGKGIRIKVEEGQIVFPPEAVGKMAIAEGKMAKLVLTKEQAIAQAQHEAEMNKRKFDPASITSGTTVYQIQGTGAIILD
jgi:multidrug efflux pump subunit AcrA (membrane-fusion protein)